MKVLIIQIRNQTHYLSETIKEIQIVV